MPGSAAALADQSKGEMCLRTSDADGRKESSAATPAKGADRWRAAPRAKWAHFIYIIKTLCV